MVCARMHYAVSVCVFQSVAICNCFTNVSEASDNVNYFDLLLSHMLALYLVVATQ